MKQVLVLLIILMQYVGVAQTTNQTGFFSETLHDIEIVNDTTLVAYSYGSGNIYKSENGGESWRLISQLDSVYFEQIQFVNESTGWIVGSPNKIYRTTDGGITWEDKSIEQEKQSQLALIYGMHFIGSNVGYVSVTNKSDKGLHTNIYKTENGGENWKEINEIQTALLNLEEFNGILYGSGTNVIIKNVDNREQWKSIFQDSTKQVGHIRDIEWLGDNELVTVSDNGYIVSGTEDKWSTDQITSNRLRCIKSTEDFLVIVGDNNKESGNFFVKRMNEEGWILSDQRYPDIHRIGISNMDIWIVGKEGLMEKLTLPLF